MRGRKLLAAGLPLLVLTTFLVTACSEEKVSEPTPIVLSEEDADAMMEDSDADAAVPGLRQDRRPSPRPQR